MPTYEYECKKCKYKFEKFQSMSAEPLKNCPKCKGTVQRLFSAGGGFIFKGSGFYATDYKKKGSSDKPTCPNAEKCDKADICDKKQTTE